MRYIFDVSSAEVKGFFDDGMSFKSLASFLSNLLSTFQNIRIFTNFIKSYSNGTNTFTCRGLLY